MGGLLIDVQDLGGNKQPQTKNRFDCSKTDPLWDLNPGLRSSEAVSFTTQLAPA